MTCGQTGLSTLKTYLHSARRLPSSKVTRGAVWIPCDNRNGATAELPTTLFVAEIAMLTFEFTDFSARLTYALKYLDSTFHSIDAEAQGLQMPIPKGLPKSHWWYFLRSSFNRRVC